MWDEEKIHKKIKKDHVYDNAVRFFLHHNSWPGFVDFHFQGRRFVIGSFNDRPGTHHTRSQPQRPEFFLFHLKLYLNSFIPTFPNSFSVREEYVTVIIRSYPGNLDLTGSLSNRVDNINVGSPPLMGTCVKMPTKRSKWNTKGPARLCPKDRQGRMFWADSLFYS